MYCRIKSITNPGSPKIPTVTAVAALRPIKRPVVSLKRLNKNIAMQPMAELTVIFRHPFIGFEKIKIAATSIMPPVTYAKTD